MQTPGHRLRAKLELAQPTLAEAAQRLWGSPSVRELYPAYLCTMHMIVRAAVPLMRAALGQARAREGDDGVMESLAVYLERHVQEELGHDGWLEEDLRATGTDPRVLEQMVPSPRIATLVGAQYYWLHHHHPVALLGHIAAIESYPPPVGFAERLCTMTGYPPSAFRTIARHAVLDIRHRREFYEMIDELPLEREHEKVIGLSALHTVQAGVDVLLELHERFTQGSA